MTSNIVPTQTTIPGVDLIYLEDLDKAGINVKGLARMLDCDTKTISRLTEGVTLEDVITLEMPTPGGLQGVTFIFESGVIQILKAIRRSSRIKQETRDNADELYDRFALAGFKLRVMLEVAPEALKAKVDRHVEELEVLKLRQDVLRLEKEILDKRDWIVRTLPEPVQQKILGYTEITTIEYRDRVIHNDDVVNDGSTVTKTELCHRYGILTRQSKPDFKRLNQILEKLPGDAFLPAVTFQEATQLKRDWLDRLDRMILKSDRNLYLGE